MGWLVLQERSLPAMFHSWWTGADSSGIFFYLLGRPWLYLFGEREIALRLFSAAAVAVAFGLTWATARRFYSFVVVLICVPVTFAMSAAVPWQLANGRTYGLFLAAVALTAYALVRVAPPCRLTPGLLLLTFCAHLLLLGSQILGPLYDGVFLAALLLQDVLYRVRRPALYLSAAAAWLLMLLNWPNFVATAAVGKPVFWTVRPHLHDLIPGADSGSRWIRHALELLIAVCLAAYFTRRREDRPRWRDLAPNLPIYLVIGSLFVIECLMFAISRVTTSIFVDRYLLPIVLADALLACELLSRAKQLLRAPAIVWTLLAAVMLSQAGYSLQAIAERRGGYPQAPYTAQLVAALPKGLPVVATDIGAFVEVNHYQHANVKLLTPIDWPLFLQQAKQGVSTSGPHEMENWKKLGYYSDRIQPTDEILAENRDFAVVTGEKDTAWLDTRVRTNPRYTVQSLGTFDAPVAKLRLWVVHTR